MGEQLEGTIKFPVNQMNARIKSMLDGEGYQPELVGGRLIQISDPEASAGQFSEVEELLKAEGVPFDADHGPDYDMDGSITFYRPGANPIDREVIRDVEEREMIYAEYIRLLYNEIVNGKTDIHGVQQTLHDILTKHTSFGIPPL